MRKFEVDLEGVTEPTQTKSEIFRLRYASLSPRRVYDRMTEGEIALDPNLPCEARAEVAISGDTFE
jgi:hypothetical protein